MEKYPNLQVVVDGKVSRSANEWPGIREELIGNQAAVSAIQFALMTEDGLMFLRLWNEGEFDLIREEWPDCPTECFVGADPCWKD